MTRPSPTFARTVSLVCASLLPLAACTVIPDGNQVSANPAPEGYQVGIGRPVQVGSVVVTPRKLVEDSRCPVNARCVWAGRVILKAQIDGDGWRDTADLTLGEGYETHGVPVRLVTATPERTTREQPDETQYRFAFDASLSSGPI